MWDKASLRRIMPNHLQVLDNSPYKWLHEMLECFNHGDLHMYDALCSKHAAVLNAQPALVENERRLREKVGVPVNALSRNALHKQVCCGAATCCCICSLQQFSC